MDTMLRGHKAFSDHRKLLRKACDLVRINGEGKAMTKIPSQDGGSLDAHSLGDQNVVAHFGAFGGDITALRCSTNSSDRDNGINHFTGNFCVASHNLHP